MTVTLWRVTNFTIWEIDYIAVMIQRETHDGVCHLKLCSPAIWIVVREIVHYY